MFHATFGTHTNFSTILFANKNDFFSFYGEREVTNLQANGKLLELKRNSCTVFFLSLWHISCVLKDATHLLLFSRRTWRWKRRRRSLFWTSFQRCHGNNLYKKLCLQRYIPIYIFFSSMNMIIILNDKRSKTFKWWQIIAIIISKVSWIL